MQFILFLDQKQDLNETLSKWFPDTSFQKCLVGMCRVITRPEIDPTRSKEAKNLTRTRPENLHRAIDPTRPVPEFPLADPT